jgi:hypothetical protein
MTEQYSMMTILYCIKTIVDMEERSKRQIYQASHINARSRQQAKPPTAQQRHKSNHASVDLLSAICTRRSES